MKALTAAALLFALSAVARANLRGQAPSCCAFRTATQTFAHW